jgi:uncharacterized protein (DUF1501 family)
MSNKVEDTGQKVFYPPSVFSYFSPGYRVRGTDRGDKIPLGGPEFQILTTVTALERANFVGDLLGRQIFFAGMGGFDNHEDLLDKHQDLMATLDAAVNAFITTLEQRGHLNTVTLFTESEFNRTGNSNANIGTDHGWGSSSPLERLPHGSPTSTWTM